MPPKQDKNAAKAKQKAVEDKTFGMKNKNKSAKVQQYVQNLQKSATTNAAKQARIAAVTGAPPNAKDKKKAEEERQKELAALFAVAIKQPKVPPGVDPKSMVCEFWRHGQCTKGFKCKYAHDLSVEKKSAKIDLFSDRRDAGGEVDENGEPEGMEGWDQETLERVVKEKHGAEEGRQANNPTNIICKHFLEAVEKKLYGWFWKCPNGNDCKYRHALPPGYVLKSQMKELLEEEARNTKDVAEQIEEERAKIEARTPITEEVFRAWRQKKIEERKKRKDSEEEERRRKGILTGREIFLQDGFTVEDDAGASGADDLVREGQAEEERMIAEMLEQAKQAAQRAREAAALDPTPVRRPAADDDEDEEEEEEGSEGEEEGQQGSGSGGAGPSNSNGAGPSTHLKLDDEDAAELFDDDDDDEDLDDEELDELGDHIKQQRLGGS